MAKFNDLVFTSHVHLSGATQATWDFPNGYGISVVTGEFAYTTPAAPFEIAVVLHGSICYDTLITDDVLGWQTADDVTKVMAQVEALPNPMEE